jgi:hypothetical protein
MNHTTPPTPSLLPELAFVVQFREGTDLEHGLLMGRVEHVTSGQATRFQSLEEVLTFMPHVVATLRAEPFVPDRKEVSGRTDEK